MTKLKGRGIMSSILVMGDSHEKRKLVNQLFEKYIERAILPDTIIHLGDGYKDMDDIVENCKNTGIIRIVGNDDYPKKEDVRVVTEGNIRFVCCHRDYEFLHNHEIINVLQLIRFVASKEVKDTEAYTLGELSGILLEQRISRTNIEANPEINTVVLLSAHTHRVELEEVDYGPMGGLKIIQMSGSISEPRDFNPPCHGFIEVLDTGGASLEIRENQGLSSIRRLEVINQPKVDTEL